MQNILLFFSIVQKILYSITNEEIICVLHFKELRLSYGDYKLSSDNTDIKYFVILLQVKLH